MLAGVTLIAGLALTPAVLRMAAGSVLERGAVTEMYAVRTPSSGWTRAVARGTEQTRHALAVAKDAVTAAAGAVLRTLAITFRAEVTCTIS